MARIEPIPWDELPVASREMLEAGMASGMYTTPVPMQVMAYSSAALEAMHDSYTATFRKGVLDARLVELLRLHSAQVGSCELCSASRKHESISEEDVACLLDPSSDRYTPQERAALRFFDDLANDHGSIDDAYFEELAKVFTLAEIVEVGYLSSSFLGGHRFMHSLGLFGDGDPVLRFDRSEIDRTGAGGLGQRG